MKLKNIFQIILTIAFVNLSIAQKARIAKADKNYDRLAYVDAIETYEKVAKKGYKDENMFRKLANAYYFNAELAKAVVWYDELFAMNQEQEPEYYFRYAQSLKSVGKYDLANKMMEQFNAKSGNDSRAKLFAKSKNYLDEIKANSGRYDIAEADFNSEYSDFGAAYYGDKVVFTSARDTGGISKKVFRWNNQSFLNLYQVQDKNEEKDRKVQRFQSSINSKFHESSPVFTKDGNTMYFTRNNYSGGKKKANKDNMVLLKIYKASYLNGQWDNIVELPFNSDNYSCAHPALSPDEQFLYFASDMPGSIGQSDIFRVKIGDNETYSSPENLGNKINTEGKETFPFVSSDNELYFATDGHPGLGGLDIFVANLGKNNTATEVQNIGAPVNGPSDDFGFVINNKMKTGYFSSNRPGGKGNDDIYRLTETRKINCLQSLSGVVTDLETGEILKGSKVKLFDENFNELANLNISDNGNFAFDVKCNGVYYLRGEKENYQTKEEKVTIAKFSGKTEQNIKLEKQVKEVKVTTDLAKTLDIPMIYFDFDKANIRKDAAFQLEKVLVVLNQYPDMKIDIRSHTDSRANAKYNLKLSEKRAQATRKWFIQNKINPNRITAKGYGESKLVNQCSDGVKCSEEEHQANRRSEFIVTSLPE